MRILNELRHGKISPEAKLILDGCKTATLKVPRSQCQEPVLRFLRTGSRGH